MALRLALVVPFLDEERYPARAAGLDRRADTRPPTGSLLVDDGSRDASPELADAFADAHACRDRAAAAGAAGRRPTGSPAPTSCARSAGRSMRSTSRGTSSPSSTPTCACPRARSPTIEARFRDDPRLGIAGPRLLSVDDDGTRRLAPHAPRARGGRREVLPARLPRGDRRRSRRSSAGTRSTRCAPACAGGAPPAAAPREEPRAAPAPDGRPRRRRCAAFRRWGACAYAYGEHPLYALLMGIRQLPQCRPSSSAALSYVAGWMLAALAPRAARRARAAGVRPASCSCGGCTAMPR